MPVARDGQRRPLGLFCLVTALAAGCGNNPVAPPSSGTVLVGVALEPSTASLKVGTSRKLSLVARYADGSSRAETAQDWHATPATVALVSAEGTVTGIRMGLVTVSASFSNQRAALVLSVTDEEGASPPSDLSGLWAGEIEVDSCEKIAGGGPNPCRTGIRLSHALTLSQAGYSLTGMLRVGLREGSVRGWRDLVGRLFLTGTLLGANQEVGSLELTDWRSSVIGPISTMSGTFQAVERFDNQFGPNQVLVTSNRLVDVVR